MKRVEGQDSNTNTGFELTWRGLKVKINGLPEPKKLTIISITICAIAMFAIMRLTA